MPTLHVRFIKRPRVSRRCANCRDEITHDCFRLFGHAEPRDKPYALYQCSTCSRFTKDPKLLDAIKRAGMTPTL